MSRATEADIARDTLLFDELIVTLEGLSPEHLAAVQAELTPRVSTACRDQYDAASADTRRLLGLLAQGGGFTQPRTAAQVPDWVRLGLLSSLVRWIADRGRTCLHHPRPSRPEPVYGAAWRPELTTCQACLHLFTVTGDADRTCDGCGRVVAGVDAGDPIFPSALGFGPYAYQFGICSACAWWTTEETPR